MCVCVCVCVCVVCVCVVCVCVLVLDKRQHRKLHSPVSHYTEIKILIGLFQNQDYVKTRFYVK